MRRYDTPLNTFPLSTHHSLSLEIGRHALYLSTLTSPLHTGEFDDGMTRGDEGRRRCDARWSFKGEDFEADDNGGVVEVGVGERSDTTLPPTCTRILVPIDSLLWRYEEDEVVVDEFWPRHHSDRGICSSDFWNTENHLSSDLTSLSKSAILIPLFRWIYYFWYFLFNLFIEFILIFNKFRLWIFVWIFCNFYLICINQLQADMQMFSSFKEWVYD